MKFDTIVFFLSVFVLSQTVDGHGATSRCQRNNMILQRRVASLFHRNKELMCMIEKAKPKECRPACGEYEVCTPAGTCECGEKTVRDSKGLCVLATPIACTPACGELEVCTTSGTCECGSSSIRDANGACVPAVPSKCTPACGELEVCTISGTCECGSSSIRDANGACVPAVPIKCTPACGEGEVCSTEGNCVCGSSLARDGSGNCVPATTGYCGPTCLTSTCTNCDSDIVSDEITLDLTTGEALGNLTGATVESMSVTTNEDGANVDCKFKARVKVTFEPENGMECNNLLQIQMTVEMDTPRNTGLFHFGDSITNNSTGSGDNPDTQSHDAQMAGGDGYVYLIGSTHGGPCKGAFIDGLGVLGTNTTHITVLLAHRYSRVQINGDEFDHEWCDECLFELNDATDTVGEDNRDLYLAFNRRVISDYLEADGYGVCSVKLSWVCNVANP